MSDQPPGEIRIRRRALTVLRQVFQAALPDEGCALLLGHHRSDGLLFCPISPLQGPAGGSGAEVATPHSTAGSGPDRGGGDPEPGRLDPHLAGASLFWEVQQVWPCLNVWQPPAERPRRFALDPREQLLAQRWCRDRDLQVLGAAHCHPTSAALPSATDRALAFAPCLQLILSPLQDWRPACWWLEGDGEAGAGVRPLPWRMVD